MKYPWFKFVAGDWLKDPALSLCSPATRGVWMDLLCAMHESDRSGTLSGTTDQIARLCRCSTVELDHALTELQTTCAADVTLRNGTVTVSNRRMRREAKTREQGRKRVERHRGNGDVTLKKRGRGQKSEGIPEDSGGASAPPARSRSRDPCSWSPEAGFVGITDDDRREWAKAYPALDLDSQLARMHSWLKANPDKAHKKRWRRFITNWLARSQEKGGDRTGGPNGTRLGRIEAPAGKYDHLPGGTTRPRQAQP